MLNGDGTISILMYQGRTNTITLVHRGLLDPEGYAARACWRDAYGGRVLAAADTGDGSATLEQVLDDQGHPAGTSITLTIPDEVMDGITTAKGVWDVLIESPDGAETVVVPASAWWLWPAVTA